jgi:PAS domain S-box-containing protein
MKQTKIISGAKESKDINADELTYEEDIKKKIDDINGRLAAIVQSSEDAIISKTLEGIVTSWNPAAERLFGYKSTEMLGQAFTKIIPKDRLNEEPDIIKKIQKGEIINHFETQRLSKEGKLIAISLTISPVKDTKGNIIGASKIARDITKQIVAQKRNEESETLHRQIFEFSPVAIWEKNDKALYHEIELLKQKGIKDFRKYLDQNPEEILRLVAQVQLEDVNNESVDLLQASSKAEVISCFHKLFTQESIPMLKEGIISVAENKKRLTIATVLQSLKGKRLEILISFEFRIGNDLKKSLVSLTDITEQVEARKKIEANEIQLKKTSEYLQIATNAAEVGIWSLDMASQKLDWSALHKKMWGYDEQRTDLVYEDWHKVILTQDKKAAFAEIAKALDTKKNYEAVYRIKRDNDGEVRWMKSSGQYFYNEKEVPVMLTGVSFDITNEKIAAENLLASEERIRMATKASGVGIWEWNVITNKIRWDAQMFRIYGVTPTADGFVEYSTWSNTVTPEDLSVNEKILEDTVKNVGTSNRSFKIYRANDGIMRVIDSTETVRTNAAGEAEWVVGTNLDVTKQKKAAEKLYKAKISAENAAKSRQQFLSNMSHEIRTPLNSIIGFAKVLFKTELNEKQKEFVEAIKSSGKSLNLLINDILDLAKVDAGKMTFEKKPFEMQKSITSALHSFDLKIKEKNLELIKGYDSKIPAMLLGDSVRLNQIILNLISNAVKFTHEGKITLSVKLLNEDQENVNLQFAVSDTGIGIADDKINSIFNAFEQSETSTFNSYGGTGLGLAIVKQLIEEQGGSISISSKLDQGSTFSFIMPFGKTKIKSEQEIETPKTDIELQNLRVLVAEDVALNQLLIKIILSDFGFEHEIVENGKLVIEKMQTNTYDIILMDLQMPEMNGFDATEYIRKTLKSHIPIIALTADVTTVDVSKCKEFGMDSYISKPLDEKLLYNKIVELVKKYK